MAEYDSRADKLWQQVQAVFDSKNFSRAIHLSKLIEDIPGQGASERLVGFKNDIFLACPQCVRYDPRIITAKLFEDMEVYDVSVSPRGNYVIIQNGLYSARLWDCIESGFTGYINPPCCRISAEIYMRICSMAV